MRIYKYHDFNSYIINMKYLIFLLCKEGFYLNKQLIMCIIIIQVAQK